MFILKKIEIVLNLETEVKFFEKDGGEEGSTGVGRVKQQAVVAPAT